MGITFFYYEKKGGHRNASIALVRAITTTQLSTYTIELAVIYTGATNSTKKTHSRGAKVRHLSPIVRALCTHRATWVYHHRSLSHAIDLLGHILITFIGQFESEQCYQLIFKVF